MKKIKWKWKEGEYEGFLVESDVFAFVIPYPHIDSQLGWLALREDCQPVSEIASLEEAFRRAEGSMGGVELPYIREVVGEQVRVLTVIE